MTSETRGVTCNLNDLRSMAHLIDSYINISEELVRRESDVCINLLRYLKMLAKHLGSLEAAVICR